MSEHYLTTKSTHDRWNRDLAPQIEVVPGDVVKFDCFDSSGGEIDANSTVDDFLKIAMDLRLHQVVNAPMVTIGATLSKSLLPLVKKLVIGEM